MNTPSPSDPLDDPTCSRSPALPSPTEHEPVTHPVVRSCPFTPPPALGALRAAAPIHRLAYPDGHIGWLVTGHALVRSILVDRRFSARSELKRVPVARPGADPFIGQPALPGWLVDMDPPAHSRIRRLLIDRFSIAKMRAIEPRIRAIVNEHLTAMEQAGPPCDLVESFALPVPSLAICEVLGVPYESRRDFQRNSEIIFSLEVTAAEAEAAMTFLTSFLLDLVRNKRTLAQSDDLLSELAFESDLSDDEIAGLGVLLLTAGHETSASMLGLGTFALLSNPVQRATIQANRVPIDGAVEELLRYLTIFQFGVPRTPLEDVTIAGAFIRAGESVTLSLPAANHDPDRFERPESLDLTRLTRGRHLAFGHGIHQCIGQNLARLEMRIAFPSLFARFPTLRLAGAPEEVPLRTDAGFYGIHALPVTW